MQVEPIDLLHIRDDPLAYGPIRLKKLKFIKNKKNMNALVIYIYIYIYIKQKLEKTILYFIRVSSCTPSNFFMPVINFGI